MFEESEISYWFMANSAKDQDEWSTALSSGRYHINNISILFLFFIPAVFILLLRPCSYEYLRMTFSELRGQLIHLTGADPLLENHPLGGLPIKVSELLITAIICIN